MLAICCLCATLNKEDLLITICDKSHSVVQQLQNCFKFEVILQQQQENHVCKDCIKTLQFCDDFFKKIQNAQETLQIFFKAKTQSNVEKSAKEVACTIRTKEFCKMKSWTTDDSQAPSTSASQISMASKNIIFPTEEYTCNTLSTVDSNLIKIECDEYKDPLETSPNDTDIDVDEQSNASENFLLNALKGKSNLVEDNHDYENESSEESPFTGFDQIIEEYNYQDEPSEQETSYKDSPGQIKICRVNYQCETCSKDFPNEQLLQKHLQSHNSGRAFKCKHCPKIFHNAYSLYYHTKLHLRSTSEEGPYKCEYCTKTYHRLYCLKVHLRTHSTENTFQCKLCSKTFRHASSLWYHKKAHTNDRQFQCQFCTKAYYRQSNLETHLACHESHLFICKICGKGFYSQQQLKKHMIEHKKRTMFKCKKCLSTFTTSEALNNHITYHHEKEFTCQYCFKEFRSSIWYQTHLRSHSISVK